MGWNSFIPDVDQEIEEIITSDTRLKYNFLAKDNIHATTNMTIQIEGKSIDIDAEADKEVKIKAPNLMSYDGKFICSYDNKFIDVKEGD